MENHKSIFCCCCSVTSALGLSIDSNRVSGSLKKSKKPRQDTYSDDDDGDCTTLLIGLLCWYEKEKKKPFCLMRRKGQNMIRYLVNYAHSTLDSKRQSTAAPCRNWVDKTEDRRLKSEATRGHQSRFDRQSKIEWTMKTEWFHYVPSRGLFLSWSINRML